MQTRAQGTAAMLGPYSYFMDLRPRTIRTRVLLQLALSTFLLDCGLCNAQAQTPASSQAAPASQSPTVTTPQPAADSASQLPLPEINKLIRQVVVQQRASWATIRQYTYRTSSSVQELDSHGAAKKTTVKELETICVDVGCFQKLMTIDGKPLSDNAMKRQNDYIDSVVAWRRDWKEKTAAGQPAPPPLKIKVPEDMEDENSISTFVGNFLQWGQQLGTFSNLRRVEFHGRRTIAMDYVGNPHAKSPNLIFGVFRNLAGTVWVDEQDHALVRIEGKVFDDYKVGGGLLADVHKGATLQMEWTKDQQRGVAAGDIQRARLGADHGLRQPQRANRPAMVRLSQVPRKLHDSARCGRGPRRHHWPQPTPSQP